MWNNKTTPPKHVVVIAEDEYGNTFKAIYTGKKWWDEEKHEYFNQQVKRWKIIQFTSNS